SELSNGRFVAQWAKSHLLRQKAEAFMVGSAGQRRVPASFFSRFRVLFLSLAEQRRIAEVLDAADEAIDASVACIEKLYLTKDGLVSTILSGLKCRASVGLSELSEVASGVTLGGSLVGSGSKFPCITVTNVQDGHLDLSEVKKIHLPESSSSRYLLQDRKHVVEGKRIDRVVY